MVFKTEVVASRNFRKTIAYKIIEVLSYIMLVIVLSALIQIIVPKTSVSEFINENYDKYIQPLIIPLVLILVAFSITTKAMMKNPKMLGIIEIDENEIRFFVNDELKETNRWEKIQKVKFEYFSQQYRNNPKGCMNYLTLYSGFGEKTYEIVIKNALTKAELADILSKINKKIPVRIKYARAVNRLFGDSVLKL
ncbi:MAG: hypothetical protein K9H26_07565 [Prolixibacteraceae bacterium]|nr:hypothetical protein [Prolixibacteraceae bacterium]